MAFILASVIATTEQLAGLLPRLRAAEWIALDTEADSLHAYPAKLCLLQFSIPGADELVDPLADLDLAPLWETLRGRELLLHGSDYDLRLLREHHSFIPHAVFDTMIAARLLGEPHFGLHALVKKFLAIDLDKGPQKADWAQRPLTPRMEDYARNDTRHLKALSDLLRARLVELGRVEWMQECCERLIADCAVVPPADPDVWRVKGSSLLARPALAVLKAIFEWREAQAIASNRPPFFVLSPETMVQISARASMDQPWDEVLPRRFRPDRQRTIRDAVARGRAVPEAQWPEIPRHRSPRQTEVQKRRAEQLEKCRDRQAVELAIDATLIAPRAAINRLAEDWDQYAPTLMRWQRTLLEKA